MANSFFQFKKFTIHHDLCAMKVGTDGVLLGAWVSIFPNQHILDVGTGTGLISLMLAQRSNSIVDAIDIDASAAQQATINSSLSSFASQINVYHTSLDNYANSTQQRYDLIVSNPPYFSRSLKCPDSKRNTARHNDSLPLSELISRSCALLQPQGRIALILPYDGRAELLSIAKQEKIHLIRETIVIPTPGNTPKRLLAELSASPVAAIKTSTLIIEESRHQYTPEYTELTRDFYLKM